jgi:hypothetical protein
LFFILKNILGFADFSREVRGVRNVNAWFVQKLEFEATLCLIERYAIKT